MWRNGRRERLRFSCPKGRAGSSPVISTNISQSKAMAASRPHKAEVAGSNPASARVVFSHFHVVQLG